MKLNLLSVTLASTALLSSIASAALVVPIGSFQPRFKLNGAGGNGPTDSSQTVSAEGVHSITYTGTVADFIAGNVDEARPFLGFNQGGDALSEYAYIDNILLTVGGLEIWNEDFEGATIGATSGNNQNLAGTVIQSANTLSLEVFAAPAEFTVASGNVALMSTGANSFSAIRPNSDNNPISFAEVPDTTAYSMTFDLYIVPEPSVALLGGLGFLGLLRRRR